jgi:hypothetical protein
MNWWMIYILSMVMFWFVTSFATSEAKAEHKQLSIFIAGVFWPASIIFMVVVTVISAGEKLGNRISRK